MGLILAISLLFERYQHIFLRVFSGVDSYDGNWLEYLSATEANMV